MKPRCRSAMAVALLAASGLVLSWCVMVLPSQEQEGPTETDRIERATKLAAGYDYAAATTALAGIEGAQAQKVIDPRRPKSK